MSYKQVVVVRQDLNLPPGKMAAQVGHAVVELVMKGQKENVEKWRKTGMKKVVLKANDLKELKRLEKLAKKEKLKTVMIKDAARTFLKRPTITCLGIGPDEEEKINKVTGRLGMV